MTYGRIIDGKNYICLHNKNELKKLSLEDNVYFTLRDIFLNIGVIEWCFTVNSFNEQLTNNICYEDRKNDFTYTNILYDSNSDFVNKLNYFLDKIKESYFDFDQITDDDEIDMNKFILFETWWEQFTELKNQLKKQQDKLIKWELEDAERDCDRLAELEDE